VRAKCCLFPLYLDSEHERIVFKKISAYIWLVAINTGVLSCHGRSDKGRSIPGGMDFLTIGSRFALIQTHTSCKLDFVITIRHLLCATDSMHRNHGW